MRTRSGFLRRAAALLAALCLLSVLPVQALGTDDAEADTPPAFIDGEELTALVEQAIADFLRPYGTGSLPVSVAVTFTRSGETWYYDADEWYFTASLYKLPMIMKLSNMKKNDALGDYPPVLTVQTDHIMERCLVYSDNTWSLFTWRALLPNDGDLMTVAWELSHFPEEELPQGYFRAQNFSARFMLGIVTELYEHPEEYPGVLDYMKLAQPEEYFRCELEGQYEIAQKYGSAEYANHTAGVIYTPSPILLVIMTNGLGASFGNHLIGHISKAIAEYALVVDERADAWEAEQLAAQATPEPTPAPSPTPSPSPAPSAEPSPSPAPSPVPEPVPDKPVSPLLWLLTLIPVSAAGLWLLLRRRR